MKNILLLTVLVAASTAVSAQTFSVGAFASSGGAASTVSGGSSAAGSQGSMGTSSANNSSAASNQTTSAAQVLGGANGVMTQTGGQSISAQTNTGLTSGLAAQTSNANAGGVFGALADGNFGTFGGFAQWMP